MRPDQGIFSARQNAAPGPAQVHRANAQPCAAEPGAGCMVGLAPVRHAVPRTETSGMATGLPRRSRSANGCGHSYGRSPRAGQPNDEQDEQLTHAGGAPAWTSARPDEQLTCAGGKLAWTSAGSRETAARQREPCHGLSPGRREQGLVEKAEEGPRHDVERRSRGSGPEFLPSADFASLRPRLAALRSPCRVPECRTGWRRANFGKM
jgi:hypothetical protein